MNYYIYSAKAAMKHGVAIYNVNGKEITVTGVFESNDWKERYLWPDAQLVVQSEGGIFLYAYENPQMCTKRTYK
jgi:hypothetical protein